MKKITILFLLFCYADTFGQGKFNFTSIRDLKLKTTKTSFIDTLRKQRGLSQKEAYSLDELHVNLKDKNCIIEIFPSKIEGILSPAYAHDCKSAKVFLIPKVHVSNFDITDLILVFYKDSLASVQLNYTEELINEFRSVYGYKGTRSIPLVGGISTFKIWEDSIAQEKITLSDLCMTKPLKIDINSISLYVNRMVDLIRDCDLEEDKKKQN